MAGLAITLPSCIASPSASPPSSTLTLTLTSLHAPPIIATMDCRHRARAQHIGVRRNVVVPGDDRRRLVCRASLEPQLKEALDKLVTKNKVVLFMKGNRTFPQCGFSNTVVQILNSMKVPYETVNILEDDGLRQGMKEYSNWPTFPQLYIDGEFFGGCDITLEAFQSGELKEVLEKAMCS